MLFNNAIDRLSLVAAKIEEQIEELQNQLSQVQSQIQAVRSVEQAAESAVGQVRQALNGIRAIDPELEAEFRTAVLDQFGASPEAFLPPTPEAPAPDATPEPEAPEPDGDAPTVEVVSEGRLTDSDSLRQMQDDLQDVEDRIVEMEFGGTVVTVEPPKEVERPTLMGYTVKELRRAIDELSLEQPPSKASKIEIVRFLDPIPNAKLRAALTAATL